MSVGKERLIVNCGAHADWNPDWETVIADRSRPLRERLVEYYRDFSRTIFTYEWVRIFMFAGLRGLDSGHYAGTHWLGSFALRWLDP